MAKFTLTDAYISVNGVTLSDHGNQVTVTDQREEQDFTGFGATNKTWGKGLGDAVMSMRFFQDFAAGSVHATLQPLIASTTGVTVEVRATSAARSATNPGFSMSALLFNYNPLDGDIGTPSMISAEFKNSGSSGLSYLTS